MPLRRLCTTGEIKRSAEVFLERQNLIHFPRRRRSHAFQRWELRVAKLSVGSKPPLEEGSPDRGEIGSLMAQPLHYKGRQDIFNSPHLFCEK